MERHNDQPPRPGVSDWLEPAPQMRIHIEARRRRLSRLGLAVLLAVLIVLLATVGTMWLDYSSAQRSIASRTRDDQALRTALASATAESAEGDILVVMRSTPASQAAPAALLLRVSKADERAWALVIPPDAALGTPGSGVGTIGELLAVKGRSGLVLEVAKRSGQPILSYLEADPASLATSLDATAAAGSASREEELLSALRAVGSATGVWHTVRARMRLARALAPHAATTMSLTQIVELARSLEAAAAKTQVASVPSIDVGGARVLDAAAFGALASQMESGRSFAVSEIPVERVTPASVSITVWNGAGIAGVAADAADRLRRAGYDVKVVTNANQFVYDTTLVVYRSGQGASARRAALDLRGGRVVPQRGMYPFQTDLLVVVGKDWPEVR